LPDGNPGVKDERQYSSAVKLTEMRPAPAQAGLQTVVKLHCPSGLLPEGNWGGRNHPPQPGAADSLLQPPPCPCVRAATLGTSDPPSRSSPQQRPSLPDDKSRITQFPEVTDHMAITDHDPPARAENTMATPARDCLTSHPTDSLTSSGVRTTSSRDEPSATRRQPVSFSPGTQQHTSLTLDSAQVVQAHHITINRPCRVSSRRRWNTPTALRAAQPDVPRDGPRCHEHSLLLVRLPTDCHPAPRQTWFDDSPRRAVPV